MRKLLGFSEEEKKKSKPLILEEREPESHSSIWEMLPLWPSTAWAKSHKFLSSVTLPMPPNRERLAHWLPPARNARNYYNRIMSLVNIRARLVLARSRMHRSYKKLFKDYLLPATIWQESWLPAVQAGQGRDNLCALLQPLVGGAHAN